MAAQESRNLSMYRISVRVGSDIVIRHEHGWNDEDALIRLRKRISREGHPLATLTILDRKEIQ